MTDRAEHDVARSVEERHCGPLARESTSSHEVGAEPNEEREPEVAKRMRVTAGLGSGELECSRTLQ